MSETHTPPPPSEPPMAMRAVPLEYVASDRARRPGILTAIGIISICVASLSGLSSLGSAFSGVMFLFVRNMPMPAPATGVVPATPTPTSRGLQPALRRTIVEAMETVRPLNDVRRQRLDALLGECGLDVFPFASDHFNLTQVVSNISAHGQLPPGTANAGADYYVVGTGRIDLSEAEAAFAPADGSEVVRVTGAGVVLPDATPAPTPALGPWAISTTTTTTTTGGVTVTATTAGGTVNPFAGIRTITLVLQLVGGLASLLLAIYLLVCGILVLRNSPKGARLHWIYVALKIPLAVVVGVGYAWMMSEMMRGMPGVANRPMATPNWFVTIYAAAGIAVACAYPISLIFALRSRRVREYYHVRRNG